MHDCVHAIRTPCGYCGVLRLVCSTQQLLLSGLTHCGAGTQPAWGLTMLARWAAGTAGAAAAPGACARCGRMMRACRNKIYLERERGGGRPQPCRPLVRVLRKPLALWAQSCACSASEATRSACQPDTTAKCPSASAALASNLRSTRTRSPWLGRELHTRCQCNAVLDVPMAMVSQS